MITTSKGFKKIEDNDSPDLRIYVNNNVDNLESILSSSSAKRTARYIIGTSTSGWTASSCDYLCDGTSDQVEINSAIAALPSTGGEIVILDGTYNLNASIIVGKSNVTVRGKGKSTKLTGTTTYMRFFDGTDRTDLTFSDMTLDGVSTTYNVDGIYTNANNPKNYFISNVVFKNLRYACYFYKSMSSSANNYDDTMGGVVTGNIFDTCSYGVSLDGSRPAGNVINNNIFRNNIITGVSISSGEENVVSNNMFYYISTSTATGISFSNATVYNVISGNMIKNASKGIRFITNGSVVTNNIITGNNVTRGTGLSTDYSTSQNTIIFEGDTATYNLVNSNLIRGKNVVNGTGTGNVFTNNMI